MNRKAKVYSKKYYEVVNRLRAGEAVEAPGWWFDTLRCHFYDWYEKFIHYQDTQDGMSIYYVATFPAWEIPLR